MDELDPRRWRLCGHYNAIRVASQICEQTGRSQVVVRTVDRLQPIRVVPFDASYEFDPDLVIVRV